MYVFLLGNNEEHHLAGEALLDALTTKDSPKIKKDFQKESKENPFEGLTEKDFKDMIFLGHSESNSKGYFNGTMEGYSAKSFYRKFISNFEALNPPVDKKIVKDIYLISCEGSEMAQDIANFFYQGGFTNVVIHAVSPPQDIPNVGGTRVGVYYKEGFCYPPQPKGSLVGRYLTDEDIKESVKLEDKLKKLNTQYMGYKKPCLERKEVHKEILSIESQLKQLGTVYFSSSNAIKGLREPQNCFSHSDSLRNPLNMSLGQKEAVKRIKERHDEKENQENKHDQKIAKKLKTLLFQLQEPHENWASIIKDSLIKFDKDHSNTKKLLKDIISPHFTKKELKTKEIQKIQKERKKEQEKKKPTLSEKVEENLRKYNERHQDDPIIIHPPKPPTKTHEKTDVFFPEEKPANDMPNRATSAIQDYIEELNQRLINRKGCLGFLHDWFPGLIEYKIQQLNNLINSIDRNKDQWKMFVDEALINDPNLVKGFIKRRTFNLLTNISNGYPENGINEPLPLKETKGKLSL